MHAGTASCVRHGRCHACNFYNVCSKLQEDSQSGGGSCTVVGPGSDVRLKSGKLLHSIFLPGTAAVHAGCKLKHA